MLYDAAPILIGSVASPSHHRTTPLTAGNLPWYLVFAVEVSASAATVYAGRVLVHGRQLLALGEEAITARSQGLALRAWECR